MTHPPLQTPRRSSSRHRMGGKRGPVDHHFTGNHQLCKRCGLPEDIAQCEVQKACLVGVLRAQVLSFPAILTPMGDMRINVNARCHAVLRLYRPQSVAAQYCLGSNLGFLPWQPPICLLGPGVEPVGRVRPLQAPFRNRGAHLPGGSPRVGHEARRGPASLAEAGKPRVSPEARVSRQGSWVRH